jgi:hypothetical protein
LEDGVGVALEGREFHFVLGGALVEEFFAELVVGGVNGFVLLKEVGGDVGEAVGLGSERRILWGCC